MRPKLADMLTLGMGPRSGLSSGDRDRAQSGGRLPSRRSDLIQAASFAGVAVVLVLWGFFGGRPQLAIDVGMFVALAYSFNVISGFTGYVSFGQVLFFGFGALLTTELIIHAGLSWYVAAPMSGVFGGLVAVPIGLVMLRLKGIYFALGMFGLTYVVELVASQWAYTGGSQGLAVPGVIAQKPVLIVMAGLMTCGFGINGFMARSSFGLRAMAIRDDEQVASAMGVATTRVKVLSFALSAVLPAVVGGVVAYNRAFIESSSIFDPAIDLQVIVFVLAGGIATLWGPLIGAVVLTLVSDQLSRHVPDYQLALFGVLIILITVYLPGGIVSVFNRRGWLRREIVKGLDALPTRSELEMVLDGTTGGDHGADRPDAERGELLTCKGVDVHFGGVRALQRVDFTVSNGDTVFIIGANGAGKTTLFNAITGVVKISAGSIYFDGADINKMSPDELARRGLGRTFQIPRPFESMTVWENILVAAFCGRRRHHAVAQTAWVVRVLGLDHLCHAAAATLAVGDRRMLELGRALALRPKLILLDEVMAGMSDEELEIVRDAIRKMPSFGVGAVAGIEHVIKAIVDLSDEIVVLDNGARILSGEPREILRHPEVIRAYLGGPVNEDVEV
ncbi:MAG: branched-chain amino acid ABC transporter ATP-binding protein/permease [Acidimicrobiales bacterium]